MTNPIDTLGIIHGRFTLNGDPRGILELESGLREMEDAGKISEGSADRIVESLIPKQPPDFFGLEEVALEYRNDVNKIIRQMQEMCAAHGYPATVLIRQAVEIGSQDASPAELHPSLLYTARSAFGLLHRLIDSKEQLRSVFSENSESSYVREATVIAEDTADQFTRFRNFIAASPAAILIKETIEQIHNNRALMNDEANSRERSEAQFTEAIEKIEDVLSSLGFKFEQPAAGAPFQHDHHRTADPQEPHTPDARVTAVIRPALTHINGQTVEKAVIEVSTGDKSSSPQC